MSNEQSSLSKTNNLKTEKGETISELAHRHLLNENHTTTDEELENVRFEFSENTISTEGSLFEIDNSTVIPPLPGETSENEVNDDNSSAPNPYAVLGS